MKSLVVALIFAVAFLAVGCNGQETGNDMEIRRVDDNQPPSADVDNDVEKSNELLNVSENTSEPKNTVDESLDNSQGNETADKPQGNESSDNPQGNESPDKPQGNKTFENTQADKPKPPDNDDQTILFVMAGAIGVLLTVVVILLYERKRNREPQSPPNPPLPPKAEVAPPLPSQVKPSESNSTQIVLRVGTLQNIGKRKEQQDSFSLSSVQSESALSAKGFMAVVADGMGGLEGGAAISKIVTDTFLENYLRQNISSGADFLYESGKAAETKVEKYIERTGIEGGSTLVAVFIRNREINYISVGDSRIYLLRNGILKKINREHNYGEVLKAKAARGEVDENEPYVNPQRHSLTAYIGMGSFHTVDRNQQPRLLEVGDKLLLCSDGVYNALGNDALVELLKFNAPDAARKIEEKILKQNLPKQDNFTGIILELCRKEL